MNDALGSFLLLTTEEEVTVDKPDTCDEPHDDPKDVESAPKSGKETSQAISVKNEKSDDEAEQKTTESCKNCLYWGVGTRSH